MPKRHWRLLKALLKWLYLLFRTGLVAYLLRKTVRFIGKLFSEKRKLIWAAITSFPTTFSRNSCPSITMKIPYPRLFGEWNIPGSKDNKFIDYQCNRVLRRAENKVFHTAPQDSDSSLIRHKKCTMKLFSFLLLLFSVLCAKILPFHFRVFKVHVGQCLKSSTCFPSNEALKNSSWNDCSFQHSWTKLMLLETSLFCLVVLWTNKPWLWRNKNTFLVILSAYWINYALLCEVDTATVEPLLEPQ